MKVFVIGGVTGPNPGEREVLEEFCRVLGNDLGGSDHQVVLCSCQPGSADLAVLEGLKGSTGRASPAKLVVHRPDDPVLREQWRAIREEIGLVRPEFHDHSGPDFRGKDGEIASVDGLRLAFLLCQIKALDDCDVVLTVGGKTDGIALILLAIAREKGRIILPYRFLGGAAERTFGQWEGELKARLDSEDIENLSRVDEGAAAAVGLIEKLSGSRITSPVRVFLSYSWRRADLADLVEAILRRREHVTVFRDERDLRQGEQIDVRIEEEITKKCNIFLALWCREYVESPYCHDEMEMWIRHRKRQNLYLLRFDETRPVWRSLRNKSGDRENFYSLWHRVDKDGETHRETVALRLQEIVDDFEGRVVARRD